MTALLQAIRLGARGGTRTPDAHLRTVALYPLSYAGRSADDLPDASTAARPGSMDRAVARGAGSLDETFQIR